MAYHKRFNKKNNYRQMKLSIIVPIYNVQDTLKRCLDSIISQNIENCEIILVNDGSTDNSALIAENYSQQYNNITCYHKSNGGLSDARNYGIKHAHGKYITFLDSDDTVLPNTYMPLLQQLQQHPEYDILEYAVLQNPGCHNETLFSPGNYVFKDPLEWLSYKGYEHCWACNKIYKKYIFNDISYNLNRKYEDILILPALFSKHPTIATTSKGTYVYHYNKAGIAAKDNCNGLSELLKAEMEVTRILGINTKEKRFHRLYLNMFTAQLYSYRKTGKLTLWSQRINIAQYSGKSDFIKSILLAILGLRISCILFKYLHGTRQVKH